MFYDTELSETIWTVMGLVFLAGIIPAIFFLLNLRGLLEQVRPENRAMQPNSVWLNLIPLFNYAWLIVTVVKVRDSVESEFRSRGCASKGDTGFGVGLAFSIMWLLAGLWLLIPFLVCWIIYWIKTTELKKQLAQSQPPVGWAPLPAPPPTYGGAVVAGGQAGATTTLSVAGRKNCPSCASLAEPGDVFCRSCGTSLESGVTETQEGPADDLTACSFCGAGNRPDARFCRSCGRSIA